MKRNAFLLNLSLVLLLGFGFIYACYVGLPYDFCADHPKNIRGVESVSYEKLVQLVADPRTPVWFYPPGARADLMVYVRPLQFLLIKTYYDLFGYSLPGIHLTAAIGCGALMAIVFSFIAYWTGSLLLGWLGVILYLSFPSNFFTLFTVAAEDSQFFLSIITLSSLLLFGSLTSQRAKKGSLCLKWILWVICIWLAIKLKSTEKILPFVCLAFLIWQFRPIQTLIGSRRIGLLILTIAGMLIFVVPSKACYKRFFEKPADVKITVTSGTPASTAKDKKAFAFQWRNALRRTFYASGEKFSLKSLVFREKNPLSFTENYGFALGTLFWLGLLFAIFSWTGIMPRHPLPDGLPHRELFTHYFKLVFVWFGFVLAGFSSGMDLTENRFLNFAYIPSVLLFFMMAGVSLKYLASHASRSRLFRFLIVLLVGVSALSNLAVFSKLLGFYGGRGSAFVRAEKDIFPLVYGKDPDTRSLYEKHPELEQRAVVVSWYEYPKDWTEIVREKLLSEPRVFLYLKEPDAERFEKLKGSGISAELWKQYDFLDAEPVAFRFLKTLYFLKKIRGNDPRTKLWVYRLQRIPAKTN
jgi:hypothetical protein